ncbi:DNA polymerase III subunit gamma/tau [Buchnera aphidicola (Taiwanaphis decaspermi)]|uniref:DNA polymerase III subunit gamma/tau n=1 Tax=Buchnera aphidicola TaxID=9 RepID=UPI0031B84A01
MENMTYQVLARRLRPKNFKEIIGQKTIIKAINNSILSKKIHHSWLFSGIRGIGKTTIARLLAKVLNCTNVLNANPCNNCKNCKEIDQGCFIDFIEVDAASKTKIEDTKELLDNMEYKPIKGKYKVYLIDEIHMLSRYSFNALLKTLEEPKKYVKIILATTDTTKIPKTILSRCLHFNLKSINKRQIIKYLEKILKLEGVIFDKESIIKIAQKSEGSLRDCLNLTEKIIALSNGNINIDNTNKELGLLDKKYIINLFENIINKEPKKLIHILNKVEDKGLNIEYVLTDLLELLYNLSMMKYHPKLWESTFSKKDKKLKNISDLVTFNFIHNCYHKILNAKKTLKFSPDKRIGVEMNLLNLIVS